MVLSLFNLSNLTKEGLASISEKLNPFWRDILLNLSELLTIKDEQEKDIINILSQPIWLNFNIKRNGNFFLLLKNIVIMVSFLLMILSLKIKQFLSYQEFQNKYMISTNFLDYYGIVDAVPERWKKNDFRVWEAA
jgi:hypothetical protein